MPDPLSATDNMLRQFMARANALTYAMKRGLLDRDALATEFDSAVIRQSHNPNGVINPQDDDYLTLQADAFRNYRLKVSGLVERPLSLSLAQLRTMPTRTQITRHDCVEGWSCIAEWTSVPLSLVLDQAVLRSGARYVLVHCFDTIERSLTGGVKYFETIDLIDACHAQTILAWGMNGANLPTPNGAPLRLRVERQLGYMMAKYIRAIEVIDDFSGISGGQGRY